MFNAGPHLLHRRVNLLTPTLTEPGLLCERRNVYPLSSSRMYIASIAFCRVLKQCSFLSSGSRPGRDAVVFVGGRSGSSSASSESLLMAMGSRWTVELDSTSGLGCLDGGRGKKSDSEFESGSDLGSGSGLSS